MLGTEIHWSIMEECLRSKNLMLLRTVDYYRDVEYKANEIPKLRKEVLALINNLGKDAQCLNFLEKLAALMELAIKNSEGLMVVAD